ncbi:MAG: hypothetical protein IT289_00825 [Oligoflexia bacterium]|nr:hypothetical protein [Oligoflexia bacterium]
MDWQDKLFNQKSPVWVLIGSENNQGSPLGPFHQQIDWYCNNLISKLVKDRKFTFGFGEQTLVAGHFSLPAQKIVLFGLGDPKDLTPTLAKKLIQDLGQMIESLHEAGSFIAVDSRIPKTFLSELEKSQTFNDALRSATISIG